MQTDMTVRQRVDLQTDRQTEGGLTDRQRVDLQTDSETEGGLVERKKVRWG